MHIMIQNIINAGTADTVAVLFESDSRTGTKAEI